MADFSGFGEHGSTFQRYYESVWKAVEAGLALTKRVKGSVPFDLDAIGGAPQQHQRAIFWYWHLVLRPQVQRLTGDNQSLTENWERFRKLFRPALPGRDDMAGAIGKLFDNYVLSQMYLEKVLNQSMKQLEREGLINSICYGPYTGEQMSAIQGARLLEFGAGSGYFLHQAISAGIDAMGIESGNYDYILESEWSAKLVEEGKLLVGGAELISGNAEGRDLLLNFPVSGGEMAADGLSAFTGTKGHGRLWLKLGEFVSPGPTPIALIPGATTKFTQAVRPWDNITRFFRILAESWEAADEQPRYDYRLGGNNLWLFTPKG